MYPLLKVHNLSASVFREEGLEPLLHQIDFEITKGQTVCLLGESGSGKTLTALSILRLLPQTMAFPKDSQILLEGQDLLSLPEIKMRKIRGGQISIVFQEPMTSFNPVLTLGDQISEVLKVHENLNGWVLKKRVYELLDIVQLKEVERVFRSYPYELSGGMKQRAMIAMALAGKPKLLIADEPTTALDVTTQAQILKLLKDLQKQYGMAMLFITHDLAIADLISDKLVVLHNGKVVETGTTHSIFNEPKAAYTKKLIHAVPKKEKHPVPESAPTLLEVEDVKIYFPIREGLFKRVVGHIKAVDEVSLSLKAGETVALVGESGSGKSTLAKGIMDLIPITSGDIRIHNNSIQKTTQEQLQKIRSEIQIIFQDPFSAMNPRLCVRDIIEEGMLALNVGKNAQDRQIRIDELLIKVGLNPNHQYRFPHEFSGGQRSRICIARALAVNPKILVCDEPTSSLDVTIQAQILDLLIELQQDFGLSYLFITHNLSLVKTLAHRLLVMQKGKIVESGKTESILLNPKNAYTQRLLAAQPRYLKEVL